MLIRRSPTNLVAFLRLVVPVGVGEVDVAARLLHHPLDVVAALADHVRVLRVGHVHFQSHPVALKSRREREMVKVGFFVYKKAQKIRTNIELYNRFL